MNLPQKTRRTQRGKVKNKNSEISAISAVNQSALLSHLHSGGTMDLHHVLYEVREKVAFVTVNRPKVLNALNDATMEELKHIFLDARHRQDVGAVILSGAGEKAFIAGADINELAEQSPIDGKDRARRGQHVLEIIENLGKPVVAAINGYALGGGCEIAMACTIRLASENARLGQPEVKLGIIPGYGGTQRLVRLIGLGRALELLLTGEQITAQRAFEIGLVNGVYPQAELMHRAEELVRKMVANGPLALKLALEAAVHGSQMSLAEGLNLEANLFGLICTTQDMKEGTRAFIEKRAPRFEGK